MGNPNVWRKIRYEDDGMSSFQCLSCKEIWYMADHQSYKFCPYCGTKWDKMIDCITRGTPRWHARLRKLNPDVDIFDIEYTYDSKRYHNREIIEVYGLGPSDKCPYLYKSYSYTKNMSISKEILNCSRLNNFKVTSIKTKAKPNELAII